MLKNSLFVNIVLEQARAAVSYHRKCLFDHLSLIQSDTHY